MSAYISPVHTSAYDSACMVCVLTTINVSCPDIFSVLAVQTLIVQPSYSASPRYVRSYNPLGNEPACVT